MADGDGAERYIVEQAGQKDYKLILKEEDRASPRSTCTSSAWASTISST